MTTYEIPFLFDGDEKAGLTIALAHGAGAPMDSPFMNEMSGALAAGGLRVARFEFPYMAKRRVDGKKRGPDRAAVLLPFLGEVVRQLGGPENLILGGKSMGGRMASMVADDLGVAGLVCLGYPFHPPGKPENLRTEHLASLVTPALICHGTRDPFDKSYPTRSPGMICQRRSRCIGLRTANMISSRAKVPAGRKARTLSRLPVRYRILPEN